MQTDKFLITSQNNPSAPRFKTVDRIEGCIAWSDGNKGSIKAGRIYPPIPWATSVDQTHVTLGRAILESPPNLRPALHSGLARSISG
jgi:hypothetical protein